MSLNSKILVTAISSQKNSKIMILKFIDTSDEWIFTRTGIKQRHIAEKMN